MIHRSFLRIGAGNARGSHAHRLRVSGVGRSFDVSSGACPRLSSLSFVRTYASSSSSSGGGGAVVDDGGIESSSPTAEERLERLTKIHLKFGSSLRQRAKEIKGLLNDPTPLWPEDSMARDDSATEKEQALHFFRLFPEFTQFDSTDEASQIASGVSKGDAERADDPSHSEKREKQEFFSNIRREPIKDLPTTLTDDHVNGYFRVSGDVLKETLPEGIAGERKDLPRYFRPRAFARYLHAPGADRNVYYRECIHRVVQELETRRDAQFMLSDDVQEASRLNSAIFLDGVTYGGKSTAMNTIVQWARTNGWLVVWIPESRDWLLSGRITSSRAFPGMDMWDQNALASSMAEHTLKAHSDLLCDVRLKVQREQYSDLLKDFHFVEGESTLKDLLEYCTAQDNENATSGIRLFREELNRCTEHPVLIAVDNYDHMYGTSRYFHPTRSPEPPRAPTPLPCQSLTMAKLFSGHDHHSLLNGTMLCALTGRGGGSEQRQFRNALRKERRRPMEIPKYSYEEMECMLRNYVRSGIVGADPKELYEYIWAFTGGNPHELSQFCGSILYSHQDLEVMVKHDGQLDPSLIDDKAIMAMRPNPHYSPPRFEGAAS